MIVCFVKREESNDMLLVEIDSRLYDEKQIISGDTVFLEVKHGAKKGKIRSIARVTEEQAKKVAKIHHSDWPLIKVIGREKDEWEKVKEVAQ